MEILEAGTGHGSLTLHLARAIHAANVGVSSAAEYPKPPQGFWRYAKSLVVGNYSRLCAEHTPAPDDDKSPKPIHQAVVHTVDVSSKYSQHAAKIVGGFRRGLYLRNVVFHVGNVSEWIEQQMHARGSDPFLSHILLDLPASHNHVERAASALRVDGKLLVFNPSITQINSTVQSIKSKRLPLQLDRVVEVGPAMTGGRIWDVRFVKPRALVKEVDERIMSASRDDTDRAVEEKRATGCHDASEEEEPHGQQGLEIVCRPKVGGKISGGGFIALWSKKRTHKDT